MDWEKLIPNGMTRVNRKTPPKLQLADTLMIPLHFPAILGNKLATIVGINDRTTSMKLNNKNSTFLDVLEPV